MPKGLKDVFESGMDAASGLLSMPKTMRNVLYVGLAIGGVCIVMLVATACWGIGSGKVDVNRLAETGVEGVRAYKSF